MTRHCELFPLPLIADRRNCRDSVSRSTNEVLNDFSSGKFIGRWAIDLGEEEHGIQLFSPDRL